MRWPTIVGTMAQPDTGLVDQNVVQCKFNVAKCKISCSALLFARSQSMESTLRQSSSKRDDSKRKVPVRRHPQPHLKPSMIVCYNLSSQQTTISTSSLVGSGKLSPPTPPPPPPPPQSETTATKQNSLISDQQQQQSTTTNLTTKTLQKSKSAFNLLSEIRACRLKPWSSSSSSSVTLSKNSTDKPNSTGVSMAPFFGNSLLPSNRSSANDVSLCHKFVNLLCQAGSNANAAAATTSRSQQQQSRSTTLEKNTFCRKFIRKLTDFKELELCKSEPSLHTAIIDHQRQSVVKLSMIEDSHHTKSSTLENVSINIQCPKIESSKELDSNIWNSISEFKLSLLGGEEEEENLKLKSNVEFIEKIHQEFVQRFRTAIMPNKQSSLPDKEEEEEEELFSLNQAQLWLKVRFLPETDSQWYYFYITSYELGTESKQSFVESLSPCSLIENMTRNEDAADTKRPTLNEEQISTMLKKFEICPKLCRNNLSSKQRQSIENLLAIKSTINLNLCDYSFLVVYEKFGENNEIEEIDQIAEDNQNANDECVDGAPAGTDEVQDDKSNTETVAPHTVLTFSNVRTMKRFRRFHLKSAALSSTSTTNSLSLPAVSADQHNEITETLADGFVIVGDANSPIPPEESVRSNCSSSASTRTVSTSRNHLDSVSSYASAISSAVSVSSTLNDNSSLESSSLASWTKSGKPGYRRRPTVVRNSHSYNQHNGTESSTSNNQYSRAKSSSFKFFEKFSSSDSSSVKRLPIMFKFYKSKSADNIDRLSDLSRFKETPSANNNNKGTKLFGNSIDFYAQQSKPYQRQTKSDDGHLHFCITNLLTTIYRNGRQMEGIFRRSANIKNCRKIHQLMETLFQDSLDCCDSDDLADYKLQWSTICADKSVYDLAGTLKDYIRQLPECLFPNQHYFEWMSIAETLFGVKKLGKKSYDDTKDNGCQELSDASLSPVEYQCIKKIRKLLQIEIEGSASMDDETHQNSQNLYNLMEPKKSISSDISEFSLATSVSYATSESTGSSNSSSSESVRSAALVQFMRCFFSLLYQFSCVEENVKETKMSPSNLAICIGPSVLQSPAQLALFAEENKSAPGMGSMNVPEPSSNNHQNHFNSMISRFSKSTPTFKDLFSRFSSNHSGSSGNIRSQHKQHAKSVKLPKKRSGSVQLISAIPRTYSDENVLMSIKKCDSEEIGNEELEAGLACKLTAASNSQAELSSDPDENSDNDDKLGLKCIQKIPALIEFMIVNCDEVFGPETSSLIKTLSLMSDDDDSYPMVRQLDTVPESPAIQTEVPPESNQDLNVCNENFHNEQREQLLLTMQEEDNVNVGDNDLDYDDDDDVFLANSNNHSPVIKPSKIHELSPSSRRVRRMASNRFRNFLLNSDNSSQMAGSTYSLTDKKSSITRLFKSNSIMTPSNSSLSSICSSAVSVSGLGELNSSFQSDLDANQSFGDFANLSSITSGSKQQPPPQHESSSNNENENRHLSLLDSSCNYSPSFIKSGLYESKNADYIRYLSQVNDSILKQKELQKVEAKHPLALDSSLLLADENDVNLKKDEILDDQPQQSECEIVNKSDPIMQDSGTSSPTSTANINPVFTQDDQAERLRYFSGQGLNRRFRKFRKSSVNSKRLEEYKSFEPKLPYHTSQQNLVDVNPKSAPNVAYKSSTTILENRFQTLSNFVITNTPSPTQCSSPSSSSSSELYPLTNAYPPTQTLSNSNSTIDDSQCICNGKVRSLISKYNSSSTISCQLNNKPTVPNLIDYSQYSGSIALNPNQYHGYV